MRKKQLLVGKEGGSGAGKDRNLALNFDAAQNYKYVLGLRRVLCIVSEILYQNTSNHHSETK